MRSSTSSANINEAFSLREGGYVARLVEAGSPEMEVCERLRYQHFVCAKQWVTADEANPRREHDGYDAHALHLAVFDGPDVAAYLRVVEADAACSFMLEHELLCLLPDAERHHLHQPGTVELSRLVVASGVDGRALSPAQTQCIVEVLLKLLYRTSKERGWNCFYIVVEANWPTLLLRRFGVPFSIIGTPHAFPDGTKSVAARATLPQVEAEMVRRFPAKARWYQAKP